MSKIVDRTLDFLELFAKEQRPLTLTDIARLLEIPLSSCHDVLRTLQARGYIYEVGPRAGFYPTLRLHDISESIAGHDPILVRAEDRLRTLRDELGETIALAKSSGMRLTYLLVLDSDSPLRFQVVAGSEVRSYHATSAGKAFLGSLQERALDEYLADHELTALTPHTKTDAAAVVADIRASEARGWFVNSEESVEGATTVSARFGWNGSIFVVTLAGPTARIGARADEIGARLRDACAELGSGTGL